MINFEYELEKRFKKGLISVFETNTDFPYNENEVLTGVRITTEYPESKIPLKKPHIVITQISYNLNTQSSFGHNFYKDSGTDILNYAQTHVSIVPFTASLVCLGDISASKDLANAVANYLNFEAYNYFSDILNLNISGIQKGTATPNSEYPEKIFQTAVSVEGSLNWTGIIRTDSFLSAIDAPLNNINMTFKQN